MIRFGLGLLLGVLVTWIWFQRRQIRALAENREAIGAAGEIWGGLQDIFSGGRDLYESIAGDK